MPHEELYNNSVSILTDATDLDKAAAELINFDGRTELEKAALELLDYKSVEELYTEASNALLVLEKEASFQAWVDEARTAIQKLKDGTKSLVSDYPIQSLAGAAGVGVLAHKLMSRSNRQDG